MQDLDLTSLRGQGLQPGEEELPEAPAQQAQGICLNHPKNVGFFYATYRHIKTAPSVRPSIRPSVRASEFFCLGHNFVLHEWISI